MEKDPKLRRMIADCLKYLPKDQRKWMDRGKMEVEIYRAYDSMTLQEAIDVAKAYTTVDDLHAVFISTTQDRMPYEDDWLSFITLNTLVKHTDEQWFNNIADAISPTNYQLDEYRQYQLLKFKYEGK